MKSENHSIRVENDLNRRLVRTHQLSTTSNLEFEQAELCATYEREEQAQQAEFFVRYMVDYLLHHATRPIVSGSQIAFGTWQTRTIQDDPAEGFLNFWHWDETSDSWLPKVSFGLDLWAAQHEVCEAYESEFSPPWGGTTVVMTEYPEGRANPDFAMWRLNPKSNSFSGWWLHFAATVRELGYDGEQADPDDCIANHIRHLQSTEPEILDYVALEPGYCVRRIDGEYLVEWVGVDD